MSLIACSIRRVLLGPKMRWPQCAGMRPAALWQVTYDRQESLQTTADVYFNVEINNKWLLVCIYIYICVYVYVYVYIYVYYMYHYYLYYYYYYYIYIYIYVCVYVYVYMCISLSLYIYIYTHVYTRTRDCDRLVSPGCRTGVHRGRGPEVVQVAEGLGRNSSSGSGSSSSSSNI